MTARTASPKVVDRRHVWMLAFVTAMVILTGCGFSDTEQKYLNVMHSPCQYPDIVQDTTVCDFVWDSDEKAQVSEGHEICDIEKRAPPEEIYDAPSNFLKSRHPYYRVEQINTELIAAEHTLCKE